MVLMVLMVSRPPRVCGRCVVAPAESFAALRRRSCQNQWMYTCVYICVCMLYVCIYIICPYMSTCMYTVYTYIYIIPKLLAVAYPRGLDPLKQTSKCHSFWFTATFDFHELAKVIALQKWIWSIGHNTIMRTRKMCKQNVWKCWC